MCECDVQRTESMHKLSEALKSAIDSAFQVNDALHDASTRASQLDAKSDDVLNVIDDSSRLATVLEALCTRHPRYACFLWVATRNLVRDVVGHVSSSDIQPRVKVSEDETGLDRRQLRRAAAELDLLYGGDVHLDCETIPYNLSTIMNKHKRLNFRFGPPSRIAVLSVGFFYASVRDR